MKIKTPPNRQFRDIPDPMAPQSEVIPDDPQWEYKAILLPREADLNPFGAEGWLLHAAIGWPGDKTMFYFVRRKR